MKKKKLYLIISSGINFIIFILVLIAWILSMFVYKEGDNIFSSLRYFTVLSNIYMGLVAFIVGIAQVHTLLKKKDEISEKVHALYLTGTVSVTITFLVVVFFLAIKAQIDGAGYFSMFTQYNLFFHFIIPVLTLINFFAFEGKENSTFKSVPFAILPILAYGIFYISNYYCKWFMGTSPSLGQTSDWYGFMGENASVLHCVVLVVAFIVGGLLLSTVMWGLNKLFGKAKSKDKKKNDVVETKEEEILSDDIVGVVKNENEKSMHIEGVIDSTDDYDKVQETYSTDTGTIHIATKKVLKKMAKANSQSANHFDDDLDIYYVTKRKENDQWQVILNKNVLDTFDSERKAVKYAKSLIKENGGALSINDSDEDDD